MRLRRKQLHACVAAVLFALVFSLFPDFSALAEELPEEPARVFVSVAVIGGDSALAGQEFPLQDVDGDGLLTVHDGLLVAHDAQFDGGAEAGYAFQQTEDGRIATMLWGESEGSFGIYVNHAPVGDLLVPLQDGDLLYAFVCKDPETALYCYFDVSRASVNGGGALVLTLTAAYPEGEGQPVPDAVIQIDGKDTAFRTDEDGKVTLQFDGSGSCVVSARKEGVALVPPVCRVSVGEEEPFAGDPWVLLRWVLLSAAALTGIVLALRWRVRRTDPL